MALPRTSTDLKASWNTGNMTMLPLHVDIFISRRGTCSVVDSVLYDSIAIRFVIRIDDFLLCWMILSMGERWSGHLASDALAHLLGSYFPVRDCHQCHVLPWNKSEVTITFKIDRSIKPLTHPSFIGHATSHCRSTLKRCLHQSPGVILNAFTLQLCSRRPRGSS